MIKACACYIIDSGYLLPALVSAIQARKNLSHDLADVIIVCIDTPDENSAQVQAVAEENAVRLSYVPRQVIGDMHIMFARLIVHDLIAEQYERILYIDADTQIAGPLDPLIAAPIPPGRFLACRDPAVIFAKLSAGWHRRIKAERDEVGYTRPFANYFNSGVIVMERESWPTLSAACLEMLRDRGQQMQYPDQDILNLAIGDRCTLISNRWNFPGFLIGSNVEKSTKPHIYHFMSNPRPWNHAVAPWGQAGARPYTELLRQYPELAFLTPRKAALRTARYWLQQELKMVAQYRAVGRLAEPDPELML